MPFQLRQQSARHGKGIQHNGGIANAVPGGCCSEKTHIEGRVVGNHRAVTGKGNKGAQCLFFSRSTGNILISDASELGDFFGNMHLRIDEGVEDFLHLPTAKDAGADFGKPLGLGVETRGLRVKGNKLGVQRELASAGDCAGAVHVVYIIRFQTVDDLHIVLLARLPHIGKCLCNTMIRHRNRRHAPVGSPFHNCSGICQGIQRRKPRMQVKLHSFDRCIVGSNGSLSPHDAPGFYHHVIIIFGIDHIPIDGEMVTRGDGFYDRLVIALPQEFRDPDGVGAVGDVKAQYGTATLGQRAGCDGNHVPLHGNFTRFQRERIHRHCFQPERPAHENFARWGSSFRLPGLSGLSGRSRRRGSSALIYLGCRELRLDAAP